MFRVKYFVKPNQIGYFYRKNIFIEKQMPGIYKYWDFMQETDMLCLPTTNRQINIINQEVITKDNIALRFSMYLIYKISDGDKFLSSFDFNRNALYIISEAEQRIHNIVQVFIRKKIAEVSSEELNENRAILSDFSGSTDISSTSEFGIEIEKMELKDITFPKSIQNLFAKNLESKIRAKADLENARTAVATARALKNASEIMKGDDSIKFYQMLETITKISEKGRHTFMFGDIQGIIKS